MSSAALPETRVELLLDDAKPVYSTAEARAEAERCLYCHDAPCVRACPTEIDIPTFIKKIATGNVRGSAKTIFDQNLLGYSCARVCPVEVLCVGACVYNDWHRAPIQIGKLQRFATQTALGDEARTGRKLYVPKPATGKRVALIGAGPASLACAAYLRLEGVDAVIFERDRLAGGLNTTGVAPYKLHAQDSLAEVEWLLSLGVQMKLGVEVGRDVKGSDLLHDYDAVFIGVGLGADSWLDIPGARGAGVEGATAWIRRMKNEAESKPPIARHAVVVGGGNTAIDVARELSLLGVPDVAMVYRRSATEMSGYVHEMESARKEGVRLIESARPIEVVREGERVVGVRLASASPAREWQIAADMVVFAIGQSKLPELARELPGVEVDAAGILRVDPATRRTGHPKVYGGGDCTNGGKEVVNAVADGRDAARAMLRSWSA